MKKIIGYFMLALVFGGLYLAMVFALGFVMASLTILASLALSAVVIVAAWLIT